MKTQLVQIPKADLIKGEWYLGRGRNSNVGLCGEVGKNNNSALCFWVVDTSGLSVRGKYEGYYHPDGEIREGPFQPFKKIEEVSLDGLIERDKLVSGRWYSGKGGFSSVALWFEGGLRRLPGMFYAFNFSELPVGPFSEEYSENSSKGFRPVKLIEEGKIKKPFDKKSYDFQKKNFPGSEEKCICGERLEI